MFFVCLSFFVPIQNLSTSVYYGHLQGPVILTPTSDRFEHPTFRLRDQHSNPLQKY